VRVLVNVGFSCRIFDEIMVEREGFAFKLALEYEWMLDFCFHYQIMGHDVIFGYVPPLVGGCFRSYSLRF